MKKVGKILIWLICVFALINILNFGEYCVKNYIYTILPGKGIELEMKLIYLGSAPVDLSKSRYSHNAEGEKEYINCWQILGRDSYKFFEEEIGFDKPGIKISTTFFTNSYVISYGRKLEKATYNTKNYWECGYYVDFTFDMTEYSPDVVYIYKTDMVAVGNNEYS